jgi:hypothetical protein
MGRDQDSAGLTYLRPMDQYYRYSRQIIPGRDQISAFTHKSLSYLEIATASRTSRAHSAASSDAKLTLKGGNPSNLVNNEWWVVFKLTYVHQIAGVVVAVWFD